MVRKKRVKAVRKSNITALGTVREEQNRVLRKKYLTPEERLGELEADVFRLIEHSLELQERGDSTSNMLRKILRLLRRRNT